MSEDKKLHYTVTFEIHPAGSFGLPDGSKIVLPSGTQTARTFLFNCDSGSFEEGDIKIYSRYRAQNEAIIMPLELAAIDAFLMDNCLRVFTTSSDLQEAVEIAINHVQKWVLNLCLTTAQCYRFKLVQVQNQYKKFSAEQFKNITLHKKNGFVTPSEEAVLSYDLLRLKDTLSQASQTIACTDDKLEKALLYYQHALFLMQECSDNAEFNKHEITLQLMHASAFLNFWKAITIILGDPGKNPKEFQSQYKKYGISKQFFDQDIKTLQNLRNNADVAHYDLGSKQLQEVSANILKAKDVAREVLLKYQEFLGSTTPAR